MEMVMEREMEGIARAGICQFDANPYAKGYAVVHAMVHAKAYANVRRFYFSVESCCWLFLGVV